MLCSILIPSRLRFDRLKKSIQSLRNSAARPETFEIIVRFDNDDMESLDRFSELNSMTRCWWGRRPDSWNDVCKYLFSELAQHALGDWIWPFSDDMTIEGKDWDTQLRGMPDNVWVQPDMHKLGLSGYPKDSHAPCPIIRKSFWESQDCFPLIDYEIWEHCEKAGLELRWLNGIAVAHMRDEDSALAKHREK